VLLASHELDRARALASRVVSIAGGVVGVAVAVAVAVFVGALVGEVVVQPTNKMDVRANPRSLYIVSPLSYLGLFQPA
jgi:NAD/NADP transhydrogenase alpha subunit